MNISVIIPNYNRAPLIRAMLESLRAQTHPHWEALVVDDGSTDDAPQVIAALAAQDTRIKLLHRGHLQPKGAQTCRNLGIESASGNLLLFFDSDDTMAPDCLEARLAAVAARPGYDCYAFTADVPALQPEAAAAALFFTHRFLLQQLPWITHDMLWRKEAVLRLGGFDVAQHRFQDVTLHLRLLTHQPPLRICYVHRAAKDWNYFPSRDHDATYYTPASVAGYFESALRIYGAYAGPQFSALAPSVRAGLLIVFRKHLLMAGKAAVSLPPATLHEYDVFRRAGILSPRDIARMRLFLAFSRSPARRLLKGRIIKHFLR